MTMPSFTYVRPKSLEETFRHLSTGNARIHAGGTDLLGCLHDGVFAAEKVVSISRLEELKGIGQTGERLPPDRGARHRQRGGEPSPPQGALSRPRPGRPGGRQPAAAQPGDDRGKPLPEAAVLVLPGRFSLHPEGGSQCFAVAGENQYHCILGGEGCYIVHPSDMAPALVAYEAQIEIASAKGTRTIPVEKFFVLPEQEITRETILEAGEVVTAVLLPRPPQGLRSSYRKVRARGSWDFALAGVALALRFSGGKVAGARIVLGGAAPIPWRSPEAEEAITGRPLDEAAIARAAAAAMKAARPLEHNGYKIDLFKGLLAEELAASAQN